MLAIAAILTTGRNLGRLHHLKLYKNLIVFGEDSDREGVVKTGGHYFWHVITGSPSRQGKSEVRPDEPNVPPTMVTASTETKCRKKDNSPKRGYRKVEHAQTRPVLRSDDRVVRIPVSPIVRVWLERCQLRGGNQAKRLFQHPIEVLIPVIEQRLATRRGLGVAEPRRCSTTVESITRYLTTEMTFQAGADIATAARLTDSTHPSSKSVIYYGVSRGRDFGRKMGKATARLDLANAANIPLDPKWQSLGSLIAPSDDEVGELIKFLRLDLEKGDQLGTGHRAISMQTVALVSFATGHRCHGSSLPSTAAIDPYTGFCRVNEKYPNDRSEYRMIWVPPVAQEQIRNYERHLAALNGRIPNDTFHSTQQDVEMGQLPFFQLVGDVPIDCTLTGMWLDLVDRAPHLSRLVANSGRHWLRSQLEGKCSTETLHALFGHWNVGTEPWSYGSCLDPVIYREDLAQTVPACLDEIGWKALSARSSIYE